MSIANFIPELWSADLLVTFRKAHVSGSVVNRNWEGEITALGDTVRIQTPAAVTTGAYSGTVTYATPTSTTQSLLIDQDIYWAIELDDLEQVQSNVNLRQAYTEQGAYSMADSVDTNIFALYTGGTAGDVAITLASDDFYAKVVDAGKNLDTNNVPRDGNRFLVISPAGYAAALKNSNFIHATTDGDRTLMTGEIGQISGFRVFMSNNLTLATTRKYVYGHTSAITFAGQLLTTEAIRRDASFKDGIRSRMVYGRKVVRAGALGTLSATE